MSLTDRRARRLWRFALFVEAFLVLMTTISFQLPMPGPHHDPGASCSLWAMRIICLIFSVGFFFFLKFYVYKLIRHEPFWKRWLKIF